MYLDMYACAIPHLIIGPVEFARLVADIAPSLHTLQTQAGHFGDGIFIYRLLFAVRFAEYHQHRLQGDVQDAAADIMSIFKEDLAPKSWWAIVLLDAIELLQNGAFKHDKS